MIYEEVKTWALKNPKLFKKLVGEMKSAHNTTTNNTTNNININVDSSKKLLLSSDTNPTKAGISNHAHHRVSCLVYRNAPKDSPLSSRFRHKQNLKEADRNLTIGITSNKHNNDDGDSSTDARSSKCQRSPLLSTPPPLPTSSTTTSSSTSTSSSSTSSTTTLPVPSPAQDRVQSAIKIDGSLSSTLKGLLSHLEEAVLFNQVSNDLAQRFCADDVMVFKCSDDSRCNLQMISSFSSKLSTSSNELKTIVRSIATDVIQTGDYILINKHATTHLKYNSTVDDPPNGRAENVFAFPIYVHDSLFGVVQVVNKRHKRGANTITQFIDEDIELMRIYTPFLVVAIRNSELFEAALKECRTLSILLELARNVFQELNTYDTVSAKIMSDAARLVDCERCSLFLVDTSTDELFASAFDVRGDKDLKESKDEESRPVIRFPKNKGIAGHVATAGEILNIANAYEDDRFNQDVDKQTGFVTRNILCMPIYGKGKDIIGVAQLVNKRCGSFSENDQSLFEAFAVFCGLGIQAVKLHEETQRYANRAKVTMEVLSYHSQASESDVKVFFQRPESEKVADVKTMSLFSFDAVSIPIPETTRCVMHMMHQIGAVEEFRIPERVLCRWS
eukprot:m.201099 g.201099  ORF g.201099 m.201099 type:complete len:617 (-) comp13715_c0_seq3:1373-3223(-)